MGMYGRLEKKPPATGAPRLSIQMTLWPTITTCQTLPNQEPGLLHILFTSSGSSMALWDQMEVVNGQHTHTYDLGVTPR